MTTVSDAQVKAPTAQMPLMDHIRELRNRLLKSIGAIFLLAMVAFARYNDIQRWLLNYYRDAANVGGKEVLKFANFGPIEGLAARSEICMYIGLFAASPIWLWQVWSFISPALSSKERKYAIPFLVSSILLFTGGAAVALATLPAGLKFLNDFAGSSSAPVWTISKMTSIVTLMVVGFGFSFLFPDILIFLMLVRVLKSDQLLRQWRYWIVGIFIAAAVITPSQDPFTFFAMAGPMVLFYFGSIVIGKLLKR
jgi:sec-independent protein translocase protein TatC